MKWTWDLAGFVALMSAAGSFIRVLSGEVLIWSDALRHFLTSLVLALVFGPWLAELVDRALTIEHSLGPVCCFVGYYGRDLIGWIHRAVLQRLGLRP